MKITYSGLSAAREERDAIFDQETALLRASTVEESLRQWLMLQVTFEEQLRQIAVWGEPRLTRDIDLKILLGRDEGSRLIQILSPHFRPLVSEPVELLRRSALICQTACNLSSNELR